MKNLGSERALAIRGPRDAEPPKEYGVINSTDELAEPPNHAQLGESRPTSLEKGPPTTEKSVEYNNESAILKVSVVLIGTLE